MNWCSGLIVDASGEDATARVEVGSTTATRGPDVMWDSGVEAGAWATSRTVFVRPQMRIRGLARSARSSFWMNKLEKSSRWVELMLQFLFG